MTEENKSFAHTIRVTIERIEKELSNLNEVKLQTERYSRLVAIIAIIVPLATWAFAYSHALDKDKLNNFWVITFSSLSVSSVCATVFITILRHSRAHSDRISELQKQLDHLVRIELITKTNFSLIDKFNFDLILAQKFVKTYDIKSSNEKETISQDEGKNIYSLLAESIKSNN